LDSFWISSMKNPKVVIFYKSKSSAPADPHVAGGLACNALHSIAVLREMGVSAHLQQVADYHEIDSFLNKRTVTHAVVEALWVTPAQVEFLAQEHPQTQFVFRSHSKMGFLQVEPEAITTMRGIVALSQILPNVCFASNNQEFACSVNDVYGKCLYLPNLYDLTSAPAPIRKNGYALKIASFGANRLLKLHPSAALAALQIAKSLAKPLDFYINVDKTPGGESVRRTMRNMFVGLNAATLHEVTWQATQTFKETIASMDLVLQLSATETFCMVAADAVASGVPVVAGPAVAWIRPSLQAPIDDTYEVATQGIDALTSKCVAKKELRDLKKFVKHAKAAWSKFLGLRSVWL
jgi:glycosyltransferase involved in cell wall biosynthesis